VVYDSRTFAFAKGSLPIPSSFEVFAAGNPTLESRRRLVSSERFLQRVARARDVESGKTVLAIAIRAMPQDQRRNNLGRLRRYNGTEWPYSRKHVAMEGGNFDNSNPHGVRPPHAKEPTCLPCSADEKLPAWTVTMHLYSWDISVIVQKQASMNIC
jgi:hypothetical protein